jgi:hypothetical protein
MDNAARPRKWGPDMHIDVTVRENGDAIEVDVQTSGVEGAPWRIELAFFGIDRISNEHMTMPVHGDEVLVLKDSFFTVSNAVSGMEIGPAFGFHHFTDGKVSPKDQMGRQRDSFGRVDPVAPTERQSKSTCSQKIQPFSQPEDLQTRFVHSSHSLMVQKLFVG